jgi:hypothetical protein
MTQSTLSSSVSTFFELMNGTDKSHAIGAFTDDASVTDNGHTYEGRDAIRDWLSGEASAYSYTSTRLGWSETDGSVIVDILIEGNFPGGSARLRYTFDLTTDGLIRELTIVA